MKYTPHISSPGARLTSPPSSVHCVMMSAPLSGDLRSKQTIRSMPDRLINLHHPTSMARSSDDSDVYIKTDEDFYVRYYTLQLLTALLTNSPNRLQEAILTISRGITRLMDMLIDREVIRNEALLLLTYLTREAEEIRKIVVFESAFEKIISIIKEELGVLKVALLCRFVQS